MSPQIWMWHLFSSQAARNGGVVRRKVADVARIVGCGAFENEIRRRGFRAVQNDATYVVFCNKENIRLIE